MIDEDKINWKLIQVTVVYNRADVWGCDWKQNAVLGSLHGITE